MKHQKQLATALLLAAACSLQAQRSETLLEKNWKFSKGDIKEARQRSLMTPNGNQSSFHMTGPSLVLSI